MRGGVALCFQFGYGYILQKINSFTVLERKVSVDALHVRTGRFILHFSLPVLAKEGYQQWEEDAIVLVISLLQDPRLMVGHMMLVMVLPGRYYPVETHSVLHAALDPCPQQDDWLNKSEAKENRNPICPDLILSAMRH